MLSIIPFIFALIFHPIQQCADDVPMDKASAAFLKEFNESGGFKPMEEWDVKELRNVIASSAQHSNVALAHIHNINIPVDQTSSIRIRIYVPFGEGPFPVFINYHGGGWVFGNLETQDPFARDVAVSADTIVVSVDYRLAPEHKFPVPLNDCYQSALWVKENIAKFNGDPNQIAVGGDSAGGNLAAAICLLAKEKKTPHINAQVLIYPATNHFFDTPSYVKYEKNYLLTKKDMIWFWNAYLKNKEDSENPLASPLKAKDLSNLPPTLIILAHFDPLKDEGQQFGQRLLESGNNVSIQCYPSIHGYMDFLKNSDIEQASIYEISRFLKKYK